MRIRLRDGDLFSDKLSNYPASFRARLAVALPLDAYRFWISRVTLRFQAPEKSSVSDEVALKDDTYFLPFIASVFSFNSFPCCSTCD